MVVEVDVVATVGELVVVVVVELSALQLSVLQ